MLTPPQLSWMPFNDCLFLENLAEGCSEDEFKCNNGKCIPNRQKCDGFNHCLDGSDESSQLCYPSEFLCAPQSNHGVDQLFYHVKSYAFIGKLRKSYGMASSWKNVECTTTIKNSPKAEPTSCKSLYEQWIISIRKKCVPLQVVAVKVNGDVTTVIASIHQPIVMGDTIAVITLMSDSAVSTSTFTYSSVEFLIFSHVASFSIVSSAHNEFNVMMCNYSIFICSFSFMFIHS